jgi:hypothetical protein
MSIVTKAKVDLDQLRVREAELAEQVEATRGRLSEYSTLIAEARREAVYAGKARPGGELGGAVRTLIDKDRKDATALIGLEGDLSAVRSVIAEEAARQAEEATASARAQLAEFHVKEEAIYQRGGEAFAALASIWNELMEIAEEESRVAAANGLEPPGILSVEPVPSTFKSFLDLLYVAATDPTVHAPPHVQELTETGNYGGVYETRPAGTKTTEVRRRLDHGDRLHGLIPDLRGIVQRLSLSGNIPTISE